ncbi:MAG: hypothetical protein FWE18_05430 [Alphaproteobacteria bacterium]|nr:hypothetical protein [Alphaproteobacteria bacterium]
MDSNKKPELAHYDIKQKFNSLLYNSKELLKQYTDLLHSVENSIEAASPLHEKLSIYHNKIDKKTRYIKGVEKSFRRFYKIYNVEKHLIIEENYCRKQ